jgi:hypothetical protein
MASPFGSIAAAIAAATPASVVAIAKGAYGERVILGKDVKLFGACASRTVLSGDQTSTTAAVVVTAGNVEVHDLMIRPTSGTDNGFLVRGPGTVLSVSGVEVQNAHGVGLIADHAASIDVHDSVFRGSEQGGANILDRSTARFEGSAFESNGSVQILIGAATATLAAVMVRELHAPGAPDANPVGLDARAGSSVVIGTSAFIGNRGASLGAAEGSVIRASDVYVERTAFAYVFGLGPGAGAMSRSGARMELSRALFDQDEGRSVVASGSASMELEDVVIRNTRRLPNLAYGDAASGEDNGFISGSRIRIQRPGRYGFQVIRKSRASFADVVTERTDDQPDAGDGGDGFLVIGATITVSRARLDRPRGAGMTLIGDGTPACNVGGFAPTYVHLSDIEVTNTVPRAAQGYESPGIAIILSCRVFGTLERGRFGRAGDGIVISISDSNLVQNIFPAMKLRDVRILDAGEGVYVSSGTTSIDRLEIDRADQRGITVANGGFLRASHLTVSMATVGVAVRDPQSAAQLDHFVVSGHRSDGLLFGDGSLDLSTGLVTGNVVGIEVVPARYDFKRLLNRVLYRSNGVDVMMP